MWVPSSPWSLSSISSAAGSTVAWWWHHLGLQSCIKAARRLVTTRPSSPCLGSYSEEDTWKHLHLVSDLTLRHRINALQQNSTQGPGPPYPSQPLPPLTSKWPGSDWSGLCTSFCAGVSQEPLIRRLAEHPGSFSLLPHPSCGRCGSKESLGGKGTNCPCYRVKQPLSFHPLMH